MNLSYGIKNFRVFDKNGTRFNIKPITILTGANCAGKSTLVKSLLLLKSFIDKARLSGSSLETIALPFSDGEININVAGCAIAFNHYLSQAMLNKPQIAPQSIFQSIIEFFNIIAFG